MISRKLIQLGGLLVCIALSLPGNECKTADTGIKKTPSHSYSHTLGFSSLKQETKQTALTLSGSLPSWLNGSFVTVGPGIFELNKSKAEHWLDGFAMIHQFKIEKGSVTYANKIIDSFYYKDCCQKGKLRGSTPEQKKSTWSKLTSAVSSAPRPVYDNTNMNVACYNNQLVALTETPHALSINPKTLETKGPFVFDDAIEAHFSTAHTLFDPTTNEWYGFAIQFAHNSDYIIYKMGAKSNKRTVITKISVGYPSYMHSFAITNKYIILTEAPFTVSPYDLLLSDHSFIENFTWKPKNGTIFTVLDKKTGKKVASFKTEAFFTLHHVNAFEKDSQIMVDMITYKDPEVLSAFNCANLCSGRTKVPAGHLKRFTLDLKTNKVSGYLLSPHHNVELPQINPNKLMHDYQYVYATASNDDGIAQQLIKFDLHSKRHATWQCKGCFPTEPIFVANPTGTQEDDGIIISLVFDATAQKSFMLVLDAKTFKEIARASVAHHIPFTVHGKFLTNC